MTGAGEARFPSGKAYCRIEAGRSQDAEGCGRNGQEGELQRQFRPSI